jgi:formylmethanofuran dehydrogenase subunit E
VNDSSSEQLSQVIAFHGHLCPGLLIGYRAAQIALRELGVARAQDEELVAICENDACGVDAVQVLTGCTLGKGNLILREWGKQVFTFGRRGYGKLLRIALRYGLVSETPDQTPEQRRQAMFERLQNGTDDELYDIRWVESLLPEEARIFKSVRCAQCGEGVMEARVHLRDGQPVCAECYGEVYTRRSE